MKTDLMLVAFIVIAMGAVGLILMIYRLGATPINFEVCGIWLNESMNIRMLLHDNDSVIQGSVIWANGMDKLLGFKVVENLRFDRSKKGKGSYSDPLTGQKYEINMRLKRKGLILINAYHPDTESLAFSQEWKLYVS